MEKEQHYFTTGHVPELWQRNEPLLQTDFLVREKILPYLGDIQGHKILDVGCGEGYVARKLAKAGAIVEAFDNDPEMIGLAKKSASENISYSVGAIDNVDKLYSSQSYDAIILSGVICFLDEHQLRQALIKFNSLMKKKGQILIATNHTDSYFKGAKSHWLEYLTEPDVSKGTQEVKLNFNNHENRAIFTGSCFFHTPEQISHILQEAGFEIVQNYEPLATEEDKSHFPHMWVDEDKIPFHLIVIAKKIQ